MNNLLVKCGSLIWTITPFKPVREVYLKFFLQLVRNHRAIKTSEGMTFELDLNEMIDACLFLQRFEPDVSGIIDDLCRPGFIVFDVGANIGAHALRLARNVGVNGRVYAFEPMNYAYEKLIRNIELNGFGNIEALQQALSDRNLDSQEVNYRSSWRTDGQRIEQTSTVNFVRLDDWCTERGLTDVHMIKIDVDGNEYAVISGAQQTLARCHPLIIMEVGAWHFLDSSRNPLEILQRLDYRFWDTKTRKGYTDIEGVRKKLPETDDNMACSLNILAASNTPAGFN